MRAIFVEKGILPADEDESFDVELMPGVEFYWIGWHDLKDDRQLGALGGCAGIYYSAISRYARDRGMDGAELELFTRLIRAMDAEYIAWVAEQQKKQQP